MDIYAVITENVEFSAIERYLACVSPQRRKTVLAKKDENSKVQSLIGGLLLRYELSKRTGIPINKLAFEKGAHGKPYLKGSSVQFSLSHTTGAVCAAFSDEGEIGVDIERRDRTVSRALMDKTLSANEHALVHNSTSFIRVWVKKEAFLKRTGLGIANGLCGADTTLLPDLQALEFGDFFIGVSGKSAEQSRLIQLSVEELLSRFDV